MNDEQQYYTAIEFKGDQPGETFLMVDGPNICTHCLANRIPLGVIISMAQLKKLPVRVLVDTDEALEARYGEKWTRIRDDWLRRQEQESHDKVKEAMKLWASQPGSLN